MQYRQLGVTDLTVSEVGFGVWTVATNWWGKIDPEERVKLLQQAVTLGVNMFDTADTYSEGFGEEILAKAIGENRHNVVYATKFGYDIYNAVPREGHRERPQDFSPGFIRFACEQSLRRLNTDYFDLYQLHNPRVTAIERDEVFNTLEDLVREGKVRYYGAALGPDIGWFEEGDAMMRERDGVSLQIIYSIIEQQPARSFFPIAEETGTGLLSRVPHASEILTEKFRNTPPVFEAGDHRAHRNQAWLEEAVRKLDELQFLKEHHPIEMDQLAITFALAEPGICTVLPNITSRETLKTYTDASEAERPCEDCLVQLREVFDEVFTKELEPLDRAGKSRP
ncbi:MAG: aldo/keto reductase [Chloroflexi bacterium]|nr:aldo/keto reductase [Chloroflexota bacterium]